MGIVEKIGYIAIFYWSYNLYRNVIGKVARNFISSKNTLSLYKMGAWAAVTGCSHGIGKAYAEALAKKGLNVMLISPDAEGLKAVAAGIETLYSVKTKIVRLDFSEGMDAFRTIEKETLDLEIGVLVNNLGVSYPHPEYFLDLPHKDKISTNGGTRQRNCDKCRVNGGHHSQSAFNSLRCNEGLCPQI